LKICAAIGKPRAKRNKIRPIHPKLRTIPAYTISEIPEKDSEENKPVSKNHSSCSLLPPNFLSRKKLDENPRYNAMQVRSVVTNVRAIKAFWMKTFLFFVIKYSENSE
jgi:hypothetical protein